MRRFVVLALFLMFVVGCGQGGGGLTPEENRVQRLATFYTQYLAKNQASPANEAALKDFIAKAPPEQLSALKIANADDLFVSARDQQPLVVRYGVKFAVGGKPGDKGPPMGTVVIYEKVGVNGKKMVAFHSGQVKELGEEELKPLVVDKK